MSRIFFYVEIFLAICFRWDYEGVPDLVAIHLVLGGVAHDAITNRPKPFGTAIEFKFSHCVIVES